GKPDVCLWLPGTTLMSSAWHRKADRFPGVPEIGSINPSDPSDRKVLLDWLQNGDQPRLCILNLSIRLRALDAALAAAQEKRTSRTRSRSSIVRPKRPVVGSRRPTVPAFA